jgi:hypothetical protein
MRGLGRIRRAGSWLGWSVWLLAAASLMLVFALFVVRDDTLPATDRIGWILSHLQAFAFVTVGAVVVSRRPGNVIGWLCCGIGLAQILAGFGGRPAGSVLAADLSHAAGWVVLYVLGGLCWELSWALLAGAARAVPHWSAAVASLAPGARAAGAVLVLAALSSPLLPGSPAEGLRPNPIAVPALEGVLRLAYATAGWVLAGVILAALVSLLHGSAGQQAPNVSS